MSSEGAESTQIPRRQSMFDVVTKLRSSHQNRWDRFGETAADGVNDQFDCWEAFTKIGRVVYGVFVFLVVFGSGCISRAILHIMIWKLSPPSSNATSVTLNKFGGNLVISPERMRREMICDNAIGITTCLSWSQKSNGLPMSWPCELRYTNRTCELWEETPSVNISWIWALYLVIIVPYLYVFVTKLWRVLFKTTDKFQWRFFGISLFVESIHTVGICLFVFYVLPNFDPTSGTLLCFSTSFIPALLNVIYPAYPDSKKGTQEAQSNDSNEPEPGKLFYRIASIACLFCMLVYMVFVCIYILLNVDNNAGNVVVSYILSSIFISLTWFEGFMSSTIDGPNATENGQSSTLSIILRNYSKSRKESATVLVYFIKIVLTFVIIIAVTISRSKDGSLEAFKVLFNHAAKVRIDTPIGEYVLESGSSITYGCAKGDAFIMAAISVILSLVFFKGAQHACRIVMQRTVYGIPIFLNLIAVPCIFILIMAFPTIWTAQDCNVVQPFFQFSATQSVERLWPLIPAGILGYLSVVLLTLHVWRSNGIKLEKASRLFYKSSYCGVLPEMSLLLTRARSDKVVQRQREDSNREVIIPMIYMCATMWHETDNEMTQLLKSIYRVDKDLFYKYTYMKSRQDYTDPDFYDFEAHIFFDDAFEPRPSGGHGKYVNSYVKLLEDCVNKTARKIYDGTTLEPPKKFKTPYGARLEWNLTGDGNRYQNKLIAHLKDKTRIRNKKRWSQIMYMYYFLGYQLNLKADRLSDTSQEQKKTVIENIAHNTFILALDGDVDFKPEAVTLLVDRMKKDDLVGAACGRIHPIGSGPMVWYQKFEYAVSHWLQKSTEHVIGCVLCSPGCFSLFRGSALMDDNVMKTYTKIPTNAEDHIQWDQGEDRWLCTLMLKQGYKVEYCAASDALTYAPESFDEFYKQRRRWAPSTMANILDLLFDYRNVVKKNQNISTIYIMYQIFLFVSSILTPGTIFLLILGAIITAFPDIPPWLALVLNLVPIVALMLSFFIAKDNTQLLLAGILSTVYSLVMIIVFIGLLKQGIESQLCSVTTIFFCCVASVFVLSALFHPQEFTCLFHGMLYFLAVPSMSMLLVLYSIGNLHVVSWGTRENKIAEAAKAGNNSVERMNNIEKSCSIGTLCKCILFPDDNPPLSPESSSVKEVTENTNPEPTTSKPANARTVKEEKTTQRPQETISQNTEVKEVTGAENNLATRRRRGIFRDCEEIETKETQFWKDLIHKYLEPLKDNPTQKQVVQEQLMELRNKVFFFLCIVNALFITIIYTLTQVNSYQGALSINLPCSESSGKQGTIEPISISFTLVFGILLIIQFLGMLYHRISTMAHIVASTKVFSRTRIQPQNTLRGGTLQNARRYGQIWRIGTGIRSLRGERVSRPGNIQDFSKTVESTALNRIVSNIPPSIIQGRISLFSVRQGRTIEQSQNDDDLTYVKEIANDNEQPGNSGINRSSPNTPPVGIQGNVSVRQGWAIEQSQDEEEATNAKEIANDNEQLTTVHENQEFNSDTSLNVESMDTE